MTHGPSERSRDQSRGEPWELAAARLRKPWNRVVKIHHGNPCGPWQDLGSCWLTRMSSVNQCHRPVQAEESEGPSHSLGQGTQDLATQQDQGGARALEMERLGRPIGDHRESPAAQRICARVHGSENSTVSSLHTAIFKMYSSDVFIPCGLQFRRGRGERFS